MEGNRLVRRGPGARLYVSVQLDRSQTQREVSGAYRDACRQCCRRAIQNSAPRRPIRAGRLHRFYRAGISRPGRRRRWVQNLRFHAQARSEFLRSYRGYCLLRPTCQDVAARPLALGADVQPAHQRRIPPPSCELLHQGRSRYVDERLLAHPQDEVHGRFHVRAGTGRL